MALPERTKLQILAPMARGRKGEFQKLFEDARKNGFVRVRVDGEICDLSEDIKTGKTEKTHHRTGRRSSGHQRGRGKPLGGFPGIGIELRATAS